MIKVFLVEDEFIVREGIKNNIDWEKHGYIFCGEAGDGERAFPMIQKLKPDIVITDIKMPFMDGLTLSKLIKKEFPWMEIIILSGYEEFDYAKEAIKIGVAQYLLKPISGNELLKEVDALSKTIIEKNEERELKEKYRQEMQENITKERKDFFAYLVDGRKSVPELLDMAKEMEIDISSILYNIVLIKLQSMNHSMLEYSGSIVEMEQNIRTIAEAEDVLLFDRNLEGMALLFKGDTETELKEKQDVFFDKFKVVAVNYPNVRYSVGLGVCVDRLSDLMTSFERASHALAHRFFDSDSRIMDGSELNAGTFIPQEEVTVSEIDAKSFDRKKLKDFLKLGAESEISYFVEEFFNNIGSQAVMSNIFRQYILVDVYFCVVEFVESLSCDKEVVEAVDRESETFANIDGAVKYVIRILKTAIRLRESIASNRYGDIVDDVMEYIEKNYSNDELSLNVIASHVRYSPNHLSTVFSQQTGQTFIKYLTDYRLDKAKELLRCTSKRSSEIALEVGYKDPHYFSYLFKKTLGVTPTQYRNGKGAGDVE